MNLIFFAALIAACCAATLDRTYLPPASAATAGGSPGSLQTPFSRTSDQSSGIAEGVPPGGFVNKHHGVVVEAASADTRASNKQSGLGAPRVSYGSSASKVGDAAFRGTANQHRPSSGAVVQGEPDLSAYHQPISSSKPGNFQIIRDYTSNTVRYQNDVGVNKYNYAFETDNGIKMSENGVSVDGVQAEGGYSYTGDDGRVYSVAYTAGDEGYRPSGAHLPTPPPIPQEILESLEQNARDEAAGLVDDGSYDAQKYNTEDDYTKNDANSKYNDRQSNKFGDRPGFGSSGFINQNQQAFVTPNSNGQFGFNGGFKDTTFSKPDSSKFGGTLTQNTNMFSSGNEYLPPYGALKNPFVRPSSYDINNAGLVTSSAMSSQSSNLAPGSPFNQNPANHFGSVNFMQSSPQQTLEKKPGDDAFSSNFPINQGSLPNQPTTSNSNTASNFGAPSQQFYSSNIQSSQNINNRFSESLPSSNVLGTYKPNLGGSFGTALNSVMPTKQPELTLTTPLESDKTLSAGEQLPDHDSSKHEQSGITKLPQSVSQTSSFQTSEQINKDKNISPIQSTSTTTDDRKATDTDASFELFPNKPISQIFGTQTSQPNQPQIFSSSQPNDSTFVSSTQRPNYSQTSQINQAQAADDSYLYNRPSKPFHAPSPLFEMNLHEEPSNQYNKDSSFGSLQEPFFENPAKVTVFSSNSQGLTKYPNPPTLAPSVQSQSNLQDGKRKENVFQQNIGVTQATVSPFPSLAPTVSSSFKQPGQFGFNRVQQTVPFGSPNVSSFSQVGPSSATATAQITQEQSEIKSQDSNTITPIQQNNGEIYEYNVPSQGLSPASSQSNQDLSRPFNKLITNTGSPSLESKFGQQSNSQLNHQDKPVHASQFGYQFALQNSAQKQDGDELNLKPNTKPLQFEQGTSLNIGSTVSHQLPSVNQQVPFNQPEKSTTLPQNQPEFGGKPQFGHEQSSSQLVQGNLDSNKEESVSQFQQTSQQSIPSSLQTSTGFSTSSPITQFQQQAISSSFNKPSNQFFGSQHSLQFGQGQTDNKKTTLTQFQQSETQKQKPSKFFPSTFHVQPSSTTSSVTQSGLQSISTSFKKPSNQQLPFGSISSSQFGQGQFNKKGTTVPQTQQSVTQVVYNPSTISSSSLQTQTINASTSKPFSQFGQVQTPGQKLQFGSQTGLPFGQTGLNNKVTTAPQFEQSGNQFGSSPSATGATSTQFQFGGFSTPSISSPSTIPTGQQSSFSSQFGLGNLSNKGSTIPQIQSTNNKFDTQFSYMPSTSITGSKFTQSGTFNTQRPSTQFGQSSFSSQLPTSQTLQNGIGSSSTFGHGNFDSKGTTVSQFGIQSSNIPSTSVPGFTQTQASTFSANRQSTSNKFDQPSLSTSKPNIQQSQFGQSGSIFGQSNFANKGASAPQFQQSSKQPGTFASRPSTPVPNISQSQPSISVTNFQFGQSSSFGQNPAQNQPTQILSNTPLNTRFGEDKEKPVTSQLQPHQQSVSSFNKPSEQPQNTQLGEIYNYQKPDQGFDTQNEHNENAQFQFGSQAQLAQQGLSTTQKEKPGSSLSSFDLQSTTQIEQENDKGSAINLNKPSTQTITSTPQAQFPFTLQNPQQSAATGEIYEYNKPDQGLPTSEKQDVQFGHVSQGSFGSKLNNNQESDNSGPTTPEYTQSKFGSLSSPKQGSSTTQVPLTSGPNGSIGNDAVARPQLSFHSACIPCGGSILNKKPFGQSLKPNDNESGQNKDTQSNQVNSSQNLSPQTGSQTFAGVGEQFGGPRKPPSFDQTGYHY